MWRSTGPRGAIRFAQGVEAFVTVGGEYFFQLLRVSHFSIDFLKKCRLKIISQILSDCWLVYSMLQEFLAWVTVGCMTIAL
jgi:hypothetical protein